METKFLAVQITLGDYTPKMKGNGRTTLSFADITADCSTSWILPSHFQLEAYLASSLGPSPLKYVKKNNKANDLSLTFLNCMTRFMRLLVVFCAC